MPLAMSHAIPAMPKAAAVVSGIRLATGDGAAACVMALHTPRAPPLDTNGWQGQKNYLFNGTHRVFV